MDTLIRIKKLVIARKIVFTGKAQQERIADGLSVDDIVASIVNANAIKKTIRSRSPFRKGKREKLYVIESPNYDGIWIYTKGTIRSVGEDEVFYILVSSKLAT
jgi:hypothetical protein